MLCFGAAVFATAWAVERMMLDVPKPKCSICGRPIAANMCATCDLTGSEVWTLKELGVAPPEPEYTLAEASALLKRTLDPLQTSNSTNKHYLKVARTIRVLPPDERGLTAILYVDDLQSPRAAYYDEAGELAYTEFGW